MQSKNIYQNVLYAEVKAVITVKQREIKNWLLKME